MKLYLFASDDLEHVSLGVTNEIWAVRRAEDHVMKGWNTSASKIKIGSLGVFYLHGWLTSPFTFLSKPRLDQPVPGDLWQGRYVMPFRIRPLGSPSRRMRGRKLPFARGKSLNVFKPQALAAFSPIEVGDDDWAMIVEVLADPPKSLVHHGGKVAA